MDTVLCILHIKPNNSLAQVSSFDVSKNTSLKILEQLKGHFNETKFFLMTISKEVPDVIPDLEENKITELCNQIKEITQNYTGQSSNDEE